MDAICNWLANHPTFGITCFSLVIAVLILIAGRLLATRIPDEAKDKTTEWFV